MCSWSVYSHISKNPGALTYESDVRVPPSTSDAGVSSIKKKSLSVTKCTKTGGLSVKCIKKIGAFRAKMAKKFSTFRQICRNFRKIQFFAENCLTINCENEGSLSDKDVSGSFGDKEFVKNSGLFGESWQMGVFRWKRAKKSRVFVGAHGA